MSQTLDIISDWRRFPTRHRIARAEIAGGLVAVTWSDGRISPFHFDWLRDNCPCRQCVHGQTREQVFEIIDAPEGLAPSEAWPEPDGGLGLAWRDGHQSRFEPGWLRANAYDAESRAERRTPPPQVLWGAGDPLPTFDFAALAEDGPDLLAWLTALRDAGLTLVKNVPVEREAVMTLARRVAFIRQTNFGVLFDVESKPNPDSAAYTGVNLPPHTDLPTRELQPGLQFLHCLANQAIGGDSIFVDGFAIAAAMRQQHPDDFHVLTTTPMAFWNKDTVTDYRWNAPLLALDDTGRVCEARFANFLRGPIDAEPEAMAAIYRALRRFLAFSRDPALRLVRRLEPGDAWVFDNRRVLHARTEFDPASGRRHLQGCYVDRDELISRIRVLERELGN
ncbi:TauD/TfdA family dioxygenase [Phenylobacterium montanum]|uniref:TauD/TfdA family dioxygenase n=1 Tax=Phenylobacterium montanum TaxID=2823693 RepID=A0A975IUV0_9CAUL|nr:TauD/TfdA family dioxygenase [Caulobacter sp. S6]QUD88337.1 TauD/TfdA family dioxygenase [Caulobacter sp. S6]